MTWTIWHNLGLGGVDLHIESILPKKMEVNIFDRFQRMEKKNLSRK